MLYVVALQLRNQECCRTGTMSFAEDSQQSVLRMPARRSAENMSVCMHGIRQPIEEGADICTQDDTFRDNFVTARAQVSCIHACAEEDTFRDNFVTAKT